MIAKKKKSSLQRINGLGSTLDEQWLIRLALNTIGRYKLSAEHSSIREFEPQAFQSLMYREHKMLDDIVGKMNPKKLVTLILLSLEKGKNSLWRTTSPAEFFKTGSLTLHWGIIEYRVLLEKMAWTVLVAAMYDVLATEKMIRIHMGSKAETVSFRVPPALITFVGKERMRLSVGDMLKYCGVNNYPDPKS